MSIVGARGRFPQAGLATERIDGLRPPSCETRGETGTGPFAA